MVQRLFSPIWFRLLAVYFIIILIVFGSIRISMFITLGQQLDEYETEISFMSNEITGDLETEFSTIIAEMNYFSLDSVLMNRKVLASELRTTFIDRNRTTRGFSSFHAVHYVVPASGMMVTTDSSGAVPRIDEDCFFSALEGDVCINPIVFNSKDSIYTMMITVKKIDPITGEFGVLSAEIDVIDVINRVCRIEERLHKADIMIFSRADEIIYSTKTYRMFDSDFDPVLIEPVESGSPARDILFGKEKRKLVSATIDKTGWKIVFLYKVEQYLKSIRLLDRNISLLLLGGLTIGFIVFFVISLTITLPVTRLKRSMEAFESGSSKIEVPIRIRDEIGEMIHSFNLMVEKIDSVTNDLTKQITLRADIEQRLIINNAKLAKSNEDLEQFAYIASHDLKEPLRKILMFGTFLEDEYAKTLDKEARFYIERMQSASGRMMELIENLLEYSRVNRSEQPMRETDIYSMIHRVIDDLSLMVDLKSADIRIEEFKKTVACDQNQLESVFRNLISNALKFHKPAEKPVITITTREEDDHFIISIADRGIGIDGDFLDSVFLPFKRLHTTKQYPGTGIGLAICKKIIERHGGRISVSSQMGTGTTFYIYLPLSLTG
jgi:signal transduction histidine kinase